MSALITHALMGLLLGLAVGLRWRDLPWAPLLAILPDLDHLDRYGLPLLASRVTLHNSLFCILLPTALFGVLYLRGVRGARLRLAAAAPLLLTSHLLLDLLPMEPFQGIGKLPLLYPFSGQTFTLPAHDLTSTDVNEYSTLSVLLAVLALLAILTRVVTGALEAQRGRHVPALALGLAWILVIPGLAAGLFIPPTPEPNAVLRMETARLELPQSRLVTAIHHVGGAEFASGQVVLELRANGTLITSQRNPTALWPGDVWYAVVPVPGDARSLRNLTAVINATRANVTYQRVVVTVVRGHADANLTLALEPGPNGTTLLRIENLGPSALPAGSWSLDVREGNRTLRVAGVSANLTVGEVARLAIGRVNATAVSARVVAVDDRHVYVSLGAE